jgi:mannose-1-phosphate guanylyltransferase
MALAAGLGSRLRPLTDICPKPLVPVGDRPALAYALDRLEAAGLDRIVVNVHHGSDAMRRFLDARAHAGPAGVGMAQGAHRADVVISHEPELLGTAGGVARAAGLLGAGDVLIWNADILAALDPAALVAAHEGASRRDATLVVQPLPPGLGSVGLDGAGRVVRLRTERVAEEVQGGEFLGVHVLGRGLRETLPERGCLVGDTYIPAMRRGAALRAFLWNAPFFDIGSAGRYLEANLAWLASPGVPGWIGPAARVGPGVTLDRAVVGEGATVVGHGSIARCVVWPGVSVEAPLADAVVAPGHIVHVDSGLLRAY